jgi:hypothetical protein
VGGGGEATAKEGVRWAASRAREKEERKRRSSFGSFASAREGVRWSASHVLNKLLTLSLMQSGRRRPAVALGLLAGRGAPRDPGGRQGRGQDRRPLAHGGRHPRHRVLARRRRDVLRAGGDAVRGPGGGEAHQEPARRHHAPQVQGRHGAAHLLQQRPHREGGLHGQAVLLVHAGPPRQLGEQPHREHGLVAAGARPLVRRARTSKARARAKRKKS